MNVNSVACRRRFVHASWFGNRLQDAAILKRSCLNRIINLAYPGQVDLFASSHFGKCQLNSNVRERSKRDAHAKQ
jgi:hypothetical protein